MSPRPKKTTFNTTGFTTRMKWHADGYSLVPGSPFRSDGEAWQGGATEITPDPTYPHMGRVQSTHVSKKGKVKPGQTHLVRIACEHMAGESGSDCRFACEATAQTGAFKP